MISTSNFCEYFPHVCSKYRCDDVPIIHESYQENSSSVQYEKVDCSDLRQIQTDLSTEYSTPGLPFNREDQLKIKNKRKNQFKNVKNHERVHRQHPKETKYNTFPIIVAFFKKYKNEKRLHKLSLKNVEISILLISALLDAVRLEKYLRVLNISTCRASANVIHGIKKLVILSNITELTLDNSHVPQLNCNCLLTSATLLKKLSLSKCCIDDCGAGLIADQLRYSNASAQHLETLNLTSNCITDCGALCLAESLRSNRTVTSLILANNRIKDMGCCEIAKSLKCFCLRRSEIDSRRKLYTQCIVKRQDLFEDYIHVKFCTSGGQIKSKIGDETVSSYDQSNSNLSICPEVLFNGELIEKYIFLDDYPFRCSELFCHNDNIYCAGNNTLINLNLAFNDIGPRGMRYLINAVQYQIDYERKGIEKIVLEGSPDIFNYPEYHILSEIM